MNETTVEGSRLVRDLIPAYMKYVTEIRHALEATIWTYTSTFKAFDAALGDREVDSITVDELVAFMNRPRGKTQAPPSASTRKRERSTLYRFWEWMRRAGVVQSDPFWMVPKLDAPRYDPKPLPDPVWQQLWAGPLGLDDRLWIGLGYWCGLRRDEIATLSPSEVDVENGVMRFRRKGAHVAVLEYRELVQTVQDRLPQVAEGAESWLDLLNINVRSRRGYEHLVASSIGARRRDGQWLYNRLLALTTAAGLEPGSVTPHMLRHSCATNLLRCRVPIEIVADQLNHNNIQTTRRYLRTSGQLGLWRKEQQ